MKKIAIVFGLVFVGLLFSQCSGSQGDGLLSSSGRSGEVLVVCDKNLWEGDFGDSIKEVLMQYNIFLPQPEPIFSPTQIGEPYFKEAYRKQRNIIYFVYDPSQEQAKISANFNVWAKPQLVLKIASKSPEEGLQAFLSQQATLVEYIYQSEFERFIRANKARQDFGISKQIKELTQLEMTFPQGYFFAVKNEEFIWLRKESKDFGQNVMIYIRDYVDTNQFTTQEIVALRNQMTKKYVFGPADKSYAKVDQSVIASQSQTIPSKKNYTIRTQGLWCLVGDYMAGPFVNYTFLDQENNKVITIDGFLYAPGEKKRDLLRQIESIIVDTKLNGRKP